MADFRIADTFADSFCVLDHKVRSEDAHVSICITHLAKGLEFRVVVVMACDDEVVPLQSRIQDRPTPPTCRRCTTPSGTCCMSPAPAPETVKATEPAFEFLDDLTDS